MLGLAVLNMDSYLPFRLPGGLEDQTLSVFNGPSAGRLELMIYGREAYLPIFMTEIFRKLIRPS